MQYNSAGRDGDQKVDAGGSRFGVSSGQALKPSSPTVVWTAVTVASVLAHLKGCHED